MLTESLTKLFERDLDRLQEDIRSYQNEANLWLIDRAVTNSAGNLCLHLIGNLKAFIGAALGNSGYVRHRAEEFTLKNVPQKELLEKISETKEVVVNTLNSLTEEDLNKDFPIDVFNEKMSTSFFLLHLSTHLNYHLGQINYHRRLLDQ